LGSFLGIDVGTTAVKAVLVAENGRVLADSDAPLKVDVPRPGWSEQNPSEWWDAVVAAVRGALKQARGRPGVTSIGLSGQMHSLVALDGEGSVIRPAILWNDVRTTAQCRYIQERVGQAGLRRLVGNPALEGFTATKLLWLREHERANFRRLRTALLPKDYIRFRLTGSLACEPSDAAATLLFDIRRSQWSAEMLAALDIEPAILPRIVGSGDVAGELSAEAAASCGLPAGVPVVGGAADNAAGAIGAGAVAPGNVVASIGTSGTVVAPTPRPLVDPRMRIHAMNHAVPDSWYLMGVVLSAGAALGWLRRSLSARGAALPEYSDLLAEAERAPAGSSGLTFLPYLTGERTPHADADARGVFYGLHAGHERGHLVRAVVEGVTFALRDSLELIRGLGASPVLATAVGGGARSTFWRQMQADVYRLPVVTVGPGTGAAYGAAMLAAVGVREFESVGDASREWQRQITIQEPEMNRAEQYETAYRRYRNLYPRLRGFFRETARA